MNTNPDDTKLLMWLDDELSTTETSAMDAWVASHKPELVAQRDQLRSWKGQILTAIPREEEPPYPDFFQSRLLRDIERQTQSEKPQTEASRPASFWKKWLTPALGAAACVVAFMAGSNWNQKHPAKTLVTYTPEEGVKAEYFVSSPAEATVIVLNGVEPLPDTLVEPDTASTNSVFEENSHQAASTLTP